MQYKPGKLHGNADGLSRQCWNPDASGIVLAASSKQLEEGDLESPPLTEAQPPALDCSTTMEDQTVPNDGHVINT